MVYEHLRFAYPGAWAALRRTQQAKEERVLRAEKASKEYKRQHPSAEAEFSMLLPGALDKPPEAPGPAGVRNTRNTFGKRPHRFGAIAARAAEEAEVAEANLAAAAAATATAAAVAAASDNSDQQQAISPPTRRPKTGLKPLVRDPAWSGVMAEPIAPPRVEVEPTNLSLRLTVETVYAHEGAQRRPPTARGRARQLMAQYHVAHNRAPDGGFFMVTGADGFDIGLVKPHAEQRTQLSKMYAHTATRR